MKIALFADIHGNYHALSAVLQAIAREKPDMTVCLGDMVNPFPDSLKVWQTLQEMNIPMLRGNHEDYILACLDPHSNEQVRNSIQFQPVRALAREMPADVLRQMAQLPLTLTLPGPNGDDVFLCHASPKQTNKSFSAGIDEQMATDLRAVEPKTIIGGHIHWQWKNYWQDKLLIVTGSVGLPFNGHPWAEYLMLTHQQGSWHVQHKTALYNREAAVQSYIEGGFLAMGGPIAWLMLDEVWTGEYRLVPFLGKFCPSPKPTAIAGWQTAIRRYLEAIGRWEYIEPYVKTSLSDKLAIQTGL